MKQHLLSGLLLAGLLGCGNESVSSLKVDTQESLKAATFAHGFLVCAEKKVGCNTRYTDSPKIDRLCNGFKARRAFLDKKNGVPIATLFERLQYDNFRLAQNTFDKGCLAGEKANKRHGN